MFSICDVKKFSKSPLSNYFLQNFAKVLNYQPLFVIILIYLKKLSP